MDGGFGQDFLLQTDGQGRYHGYLRRPSGSGRGGDYAIEIVVIARTADKTLGGMEVIQTTTIDPPLGPSECPLAPCGAVQFEVANPDGLPLVAATPMALSSLHDGGVTIGYEIPHVIPEFTNLGEGRYLATGLVPRWEYRMVVSASGYKCRDELKVKTEPGMFTLGSGEALIAGKLAVDWWGRKAVPGLIAKLNHLDRYQRQGACHELGSLGSEAKEAVQALIGALNEDKLNTVRFAAAEALGKIGAAAKAAVPSLIAALGRDRDGVPREAATALGRIRDPAAIPALTAALQHEEREVRIAAASALREIGPAVDLPSQYQDALNRIAQSLLKLCDTHPELVRFGEDVQHSNERVHHGAVIVDFSYEHNYIAVTKIKPAGPKIPGKPWCRIAVNIHPGNWEDRQMGVAIQEGEPAPSRIYRFSELPLIAVVSVESESEALRSDVNEIIDRELSVMCVAKPDAEEAAKPREAVTAVIREELENPRGGKPAGTGDGLPEQILPILQAMKQEVVNLGAEYPQLAEAKDIEVTPDEWLFEHDCRFMGKRGYENTGPFPVAIGLRVMTTERFREQVDKVAMSEPGYRWEYLDLVGWPTLHVGEGVSPVLTGKLQEVLKNVFVKVGPLNREALAAGLPAGIQNERDRLLAEADAKIRDGVRKLAETYPLLKKGMSWERLKLASAPGRIGIHIRRTQAGKGRTDALEFPPSEAFSILVVVKPPPDEIEQLALRRMYPRLGLVGQVGTRAANPDMDAALKKLVADALEPLTELEERVSKQPHEAAPATSNFRRGQSEAEAVKKLRNELSAGIQRLSGKSSIRQETRALIDALVERNVDIVSLLVGKCREGDVRRNSMIFEALRYVGSERSKAALLKIAQNRQYTDSYALGDRVATTP